MTREPRQELNFLCAKERAQTFGAAFERLVGVMAYLRGENGCEWDRAQTLESLKAYLVEEAYEVLDAIDDGKPSAHLEELGDLLLQVVFQAEIRRRENQFDAADVANAISAKLVRRHPHIFSDAPVTETSWERIKAEEKPNRAFLDSVPRSLPGLLQAQKLGKKAAKVGFDWPNLEGAIEKLDEELCELREALESSSLASIEHELGDVLFSLTNVARHLNVDAEASLKASAQRFRRRFGYIEDKLQSEGKALADQSLVELERLWQESKKKG